MNQTKKRLNIINLAISITDIETIQLQISKLSILTSDEKICEILAQLEAKNYANTQKLITEYIETPTNEWTHDTVPEKLEEFDIFFKETEKEESLSPKQEKQEEIQEITDLDAFIDPLPQAKEISTKSVNYDSILNIIADDILPNNIDLKSRKKVIKEDNSNDDIEVAIAEAQETETIYYEPVIAIEEELSEIYERCPLKEINNESFPSVDAWILKVSSEKHSEEEIEEMIQHIDTLNQTNKVEAAKLLLVSSATESKYAHFRLARELYKGDLFEKNISKSFAIIASLAIHDEYPEAICDLAQFYENGIGTEKDPIKAELLYKQAMDLGIKRASAHYEKIRK